MLRKAAWAIGVLCGVSHTTLPDWDAIKPSFPYLSQVQQIVLCLSGWCYSLILSRLIPSSLTASHYRRRRDSAECPRDTDHCASWRTSTKRRSTSHSTLGVRERERKRERERTREKDTETQRGIVFQLSICQRCQSLPVLQATLSTLATVIKLDERQALLLVRMGTKTEEEKVLRPYLFLIYCSQRC